MVMRTTSNVDVGFDIIGINRKGELMYVDQIGR